jgi:anaerobic C4-dicarboxylate transporter
MPPGMERLRGRLPQNPWVRRRWWLMLFVVATIVVFAVLAESTWWRTGIVLTVGLPALVAIFALASLEETMATDQRRPTRVQVRLALRTAVAGVLVVAAIGAFAATVLSVASR